MHFLFNLIYYYKKFSEDQLKLFQPLLRVNPNIIYFNSLFLLCIYSFNENEESDEEESDWKQRRYSLQLHSKGYRRTQAKVSTQPQLDSEDENEQPSEFLSRQNTM